MAWSFWQSARPGRLSNRPSLRRKRYFPTPFSLVRSRGEATMAEIGGERDFWDGLRRKIGQLTRRTSDVDDLLHDAFLRLERYKIGKKVDNPGGFLVHAALNLGVDQYRREQRQDP